MIDKIREMCEKASVIPIVILKTPRAGETVDNGMGVDFELAEWALIFKKTKESSKSAFDFEFGTRHQEELKISIKKFNVDRMDSLEGMIQELKETDAYEVVWQDKTYKGPEAIKATLTRTGVGFSVDCVKWYSVSVTYEEAKKYIGNFVEAMSIDELLIDILKDHPDFEKIAHNSGFPRDSMIHHPHSFVQLTIDGIIFNFGYKEEAGAEFERHKEGSTWQKEDMTTEEADKLTRRFEEEKVGEKATKYVESLYSLDKEKASD